jgi:hypothetical protein
MAEGNPGSSLRTDVFQRRSNFDPLTTVEQNDHVGAAAYLMKRAVAAVAVGALPDGIPVIVSGSRDGTVRVWGLAGGTPVAPQLDLPESVSGVVVTTTSSSPRPGPISRSTIECARYPRASALTTNLYRFGVPGHVGCHLARRSVSTGRCAAPGWC